MALPADITQGEVFQVCDELMQSGTWVTNKVVHKTLGRGSLSTVNKYTKLWQQKYLESLHQEGEDQGIAAPKAVMDIAGQIYEVALEQAFAQAKRDFEGREQALAEERQKIEQVRVEAIDKVDQADRALISERAAREQIQNSLNNEREASAKLSDKLRTALDELVSLSEIHKNLQTTLTNTQAEQEDERRQAAEALSKEQKRSDALERQLTARYEEEAARTREAIANVKRLEHELKTAQARIDSQTEHLLKAERERAEISASAAGLRVDVEALQQDKEQLIRKLETCTAQLDAANQERASLAGELKATVSELGRARADLEAQTQRASEAAAAVEALARELKKKTRTQKA
ncbi:hypothetical protein BJI67_16160 (plasmid) [Acidihalobacter aeolianus]|uniref:KfrA N-terminal DNA-binding domain-containing protein n=1 Tax=Acidihalobacter aeolianus TaxID=2792603 RepID=A0A1D8KCS9_9GAMM|nr:DNA-binding protein [Acidihalobacter aeolianus]AOV18773.1 hypothetical protein BJI67_16160 [Acidihalobacter aeolianus]